VGVQPVMLQPDPIEIIERTLRDVIHDVLSDKYGPNWAVDDNAGLGTNWSNQLAEKSKDDQGVQKSEPVYDIPIAYAEFSDLGKLLEKHKDLFVPIFSDWETFLAYYRTAERLRKIVKHHRDISPTQSSLLVGIAGEIEDAANLWRIGNRLEVKRTILQFTELISTQYKTDDQIIGESVESVRQWRDRIISAIQASPLDPHKFDKQERALEFHVRGQHLSISISTGPNTSSTYQIGSTPYKTIHSELRYDSGCRANLDDLLTAIGKPYPHIAYDLIDKIDVEALRRWSTERAGLHGGSTSSNAELTGIDYSLLGGRLHVGAWKYTDMTDRRGGRVFATFDAPKGFWRAHSLIGPKQIVGFMVGSITPKAMMHLVRLAVLQ